MEEGYGQMEMEEERTLTSKAEIGIYNRNC